jgi:hypothetical protein
VRREEHTREKAIAASAKKAALSPRSTAVHSVVSFIVLPRFFPGSLRSFPGPAPSDELPRAALEAGPAPRAETNTCARGAEHPRAAEAAPAGFSLTRRRRLPILLVEQLQPRLVIVRGQLGADLAVLVEQD